VGDVERGHAGLLEDHAQIVAQPQLGSRFDSGSSSNNSCGR
jgi:hypothetical protein